MSRPQLAPGAHALTVTQLCERWQCCRHTVMDAIALGDLKAFRLGRNWRVLIVEVSRFEAGACDAR